MDAFTIKDLENLSGIKAHTLRIWEQRYSFLKPGRSFTNIRYYSNEELKTILNISLLNRYGFKISHIDKMNAEEIREKLLSLTQAGAQQDRVVHELIQSMIDLNMEAFDTVLDNYILARGIERAVTQIIFPFLEKIGILWLTNHINPAQEHLVTNIIRQKLIVGIEAVRPAVLVKKTVLLFLPENEHHELGLLFMYYLLKSRGAKVIYLGASIPIKDVQYVVNLKQPDYLYCHLTTVGQNFNFDKFLQQMAKHFPTLPVLVSGMLTQTYEKKIHPPIQFKRSFKEVMEFITAL
ncbi:MAG: MerR family transcriptional regulator [Ferruginibacter sp.]|nr:MerR family transcriptional regulator [Ferruginibacter sp.]